MILKGRTPISQTYLRIEKITNFQNHKSNGELSHRNIFTCSAFNIFSPNIQKTLVFSGLLGFLVGILYIIAISFYMDISS